MGGFLGTVTPGPRVTAALKAEPAKYRWVAATVGSNSASGYQLATGYPVMALGGFNGTDPSPTLAQFQQLVAKKEIHYFIGGDNMQIPAQFRHMRGGTDTTNTPAQQISRWVTGHFRPITIEGATVYALG